ncbi:Sir2 family NAD-dependent protein deacetylase [Gulosibacter molinativorax]|uniref:protein acetyllysine N-acetyltransferase n=1 Tax=Gulosibacter molinativorax TaxID=256821 RepID=A0ABT7C8Q0_9MICO|nr:Sir2 family NAD-dependent protein deacetylase [Gulosibacter molinativorax]MDJ1371144.1 NAD-dependent deacetylase [Gulosibacter molinativorax]QUY61504.1 NAD-dependent protein deacetylase [Gulosibacter molinativorax]
MDEAGYIRAGAEELADFLATRNAAVITGAGLSTDSGIPDYRSPGAPKRTPMTWQDFESSDERQARYWAGAAIGWRRFDSFSPNVGHFALARLEAAGNVLGVATQNVDGLHLRAGSQRVIELHGHLRSVRCLNCGTEVSRDEIVERMRRDNPDVAAIAAEAEHNPDGDASVSDEVVANFNIPKCLVCGGMLAPNVVMFGQFVRPEDARAAEQLVNESDSVVVVGSSLAVNTAVRLLHRAHRQGKPIAMVNRGETPLDHLAAFRVDAGISEVVAGAAEILGI